MPLPAGHPPFSSTFVISRGSSSKALVLLVRMQIRQKVGHGLVVYGIAKFQALKFTFQGLKFPVKSLVFMVRRRIF